MPKYERIYEDKSDYYVTGSVFADQKRLREFYNDNINFLTDAYDIAKEVLKVKSKQTLRIRNIRAYSGLYKNGLKQVEVDIRSESLESIVSTIVHELRHAKQYEDKRLKNDEGSWCFWRKRGEKNYIRIRQYSPSENRQKYLDLPWEMDARKAEKRYLPIVLKRLEEKYPNKVVYKKIKFKKVA